ncbi:MAG: TM2 domain-containing protein [Dehalococcoidia bacterium]
MTDAQKMVFLSTYNGEKKDRTLALILSIFLGELGIDRFYVGDIGLGFGKLLTLGGLGVWWLIDLFLIMGRVDSINREKARTAAKEARMQ